jgi:hypothetical protein
MYLFAKTSFGIHTTTIQLLESSDINILIPSVGGCWKYKGSVTQVDYMCPSVAQNGCQDRLCISLRGIKSMD